MDRSSCKAVPPPETQQTASRCREKLREGERGENDEGDKPAHVQGDQWKVNEAYLCDFFLTVATYKYQRFPSQFRN